MKPTSRSQALANIVYRIRIEVDGTVKERWPKKGEGYLALAPAVKKYDELTTKYGTLDKRPKRSGEISLTGHLIDQLYSDQIKVDRWNSALDSWWPTVMLTHASPSRGIISETVAKIVARSKALQKQ